MKKAKSAVALLLAAFCVVLFTQPALGIDPPVLTTEIHGQSLSLNSPHNHSFSAWHILNDYSSVEINDLNNYWDNKFVKPQYPYTHRLDTATAKYNCHSYAWIYHILHYQQWDSTWYNIPNDSDFFNCANSYIPVSGSITVGDILLYVEDIDDDNYIIRHSAVVVSTDGTASNTILVSKWGPAGLYKHKIYTGHPYTSYGIFYYHVSATHNLSYTDTGSVTSHLVSCSCGKTFSDPHNYQSAYGGTAVICSYCGHLEYIRSANSVIKEEQ